MSVYDDPAARVEVARLATREAVREALSEVYSGAGREDADALLDHLADRGCRVVRA